MKRYKILFLFSVLLFVGVGTAATLPTAVTSSNTSELPATTMNDSNIATGGRINGAANINEVRSLIGNVTAAGNITIRGYFIDNAAVDLGMVNLSFWNFTSSTWNKVKPNLLSGCLTSGQQGYCNYTFQVNNSYISTTNTVRYNISGSVYIGIVTNSANITEIIIDASDPSLNTPMNEGTGTWANDTSGFNNNGSITNAAWTTDNVNGSALSFDGSGDYVNVSTSTSLNATTGLTMAAWFKTSDLVNGQSIMTKTIAGAYNTQYQMLLSNGLILPQVFKATTTYQAASNVAVANNTWTYAQATYDGTTLRLYVNGVLQSTTATVTAPTDGGAGVTYIGAFDPSTYIFRGKIDEPKIYNYALNATERTADYQQFQPVPAYPTGGMTIAATYPPQTSTINFSWHDTEYNADELIVAKDTNFNLIVVDQFTANDYYAANLESGNTYFWKVRQYNTTSGTYGDTSQTENFTLSRSSTSTNNTIQGNVYELINGAVTAVDQATVFIYNSTWSSTQVTGTNGYYLFQNVYNSTYYIQASKKDYVSSNLQTVNMTWNTSATQDILLEKCTSAYTCGSGSDYVKFIVQNWFGNIKYSNILATVYKNGVTLTTSGTTGTDGAVTFLLVKDASYTITFVNTTQGISESVVVIPSDNTYYIVVDVASTPWWSNTTNSEPGTVFVSVASGTTNATHGWINISYIDSLSQTSGLVFWINQTNKSGQTTAQIVNYSFASGATGNTSHNFSIYGYSGRSYIAAVTSSHSTFGSIYRAFSVHFNGNTMALDDFIPIKMKAVIAIGFSLFIAAIFGATRAAIGASIFSFLGWFFLGFGWLDYFNTTTIIAGYSLATAAAVLALMNDRKKAEGMV